MIEELKALLKKYEYELKEKERTYPLMQSSTTLGKMFVYRQIIRYLRKLIGKE